MTPDMAFECLLVSRDSQVVCTLNRVLDDLAICTKHCYSASQAFSELMGSSIDLVVIDWEEERSAIEFLDRLNTLGGTRRRTVVAVSTSDCCVPGAYLVLRKPVTAESGAQSFKVVYSRMLQDHRRHARYVVMTPVIATRGQNQLVPVTITNIGDGGVGLSTAERLTIGDMLTFRLSLREARRAIYIEARVLWTRDYGISGCEFVRIPPADLDILHGWLKSKCQIKPPLFKL